MAQKITGYVKLQIPAGKATPAPPVGPALGQHGINIAAFTKEFNERTKNDAGLIIPVVITVYADRSFSFITSAASRYLYISYKRPARFRLNMAFSPFVFARGSRAISSLYVFSEFLLYE